MEEEKQENLRVKWKNNQIIRNKDTGHPLLVLHVYKNICTIVVDLEDSNKLAQTFALLPREYSNYAVDSEMKVEEKEDMPNIWQYNPPENYPQISP